MHRRIACILLQGFAVFALCLQFSCSRSPAQDNVRIEAKVKQVQELAPKWIESGGNPNEIAPLGQDLDKLLRAGRPKEAEELLDRILAIVKNPAAEPKAIAPPRVQVKVYDAGGRPVPREQLLPKHMDAIVTGVYALDTDYEPSPVHITSPKDGVIALSDPVPTPLVLHFFPRVPGFGQVKVYADNGGKGYLPPASGGWEIDLPLEATKSRIANTRELVRSREAKVFRKETLDRLSSAEQHLGVATRGKAVDAGEVYRSLNDALWAGEMATLDVARSTIEKRGPRNGFRFGIFTQGHEQWGKAQRAELRQMFNFASVLDFFIRSYEDEKGNPRPEKAERAIAMLEQLGIEVKGHPLIFLLPFNTPPRLQGKEYEAIVRAMRTRVVREVGRFKGRVKVWDVINEPNFSQAPYTLAQFTELAHMAMKWVKESDPAAIRVVNVNWPTGEYVVVPVLRNLAPKAADGSVQTSRQLLSAWLAAGVDYDVIGIEMYYIGLDMMEISRLFDRYARIGKPIHITEAAIASSPGVDKRSQYFQNPEFATALGEWHQPWNEQVQADWVEQFYTIAYSKPKVEAISWTDLVDSFWPFGGLLHRDLTPKESYRRLKRLLESWGFHGVRGFHGAR